MRRLLPLLLTPLVLADVVTHIPDAAPPGFEEWESPIVLPAKNVSGDGDWGAAVAKARAFVAKLTLEEKVNLTTGVGTNGRCVGNTGRVTRLNFPGFCLQDSPLGVRLTDLVSAFPAPINAAATFDHDLIYQRGKAMGFEHHGKGVNVALSPMTNLGRVAAGGRNWEGFGGDPFLAGVGTALTVKGYQDNNVIACVKHYIANEQEHFRGGSEAAQIYSSNVDDKTLHEVYAWPFAEAVRAGVGAVMCSYNKVNQTQACQNSKLLNGVLKEELDFQGFVLSDWAALISGVQPALAGCDMNMPGFKAYGQGPVEPDPTHTTNSWWGSALIEAVNNGSVPLTRLDDMVTRSMAAFFKLNQDAPDYPAVNFDYNTEDTFRDGVRVNEHVNVQADHFKLIRAIGAASTVLLKNTHSALPLDLSKLTRLAVLGSDAGPNPDGPNGCGDRGCDQGTLAMGWGSGTANFPYLVDPLAAISQIARAKKPGLVIEGVLNDYNRDQVASVASHADACLVFVNADSGEGYITVGGNAGDRTNLTLWHGGEALISTTAARCANTIVTLHAVGPVLVESWIDNPNVTAVLHAGIPGQESGNAVADVLFGDVNPSGRLPYTVAKKREDYSADVVYSSAEGTPQLVYGEGGEIDYRHFDAKNIAPRFEFGFGLSYTTFKYTGLSVTGGGHAKREPGGDSGCNIHGCKHARAEEQVPSKGLSAATQLPQATPADSAPSVQPGKALGTSSAVAGAASLSPNSFTPASPPPTPTGSAPPVLVSPTQPTPGGPDALYAPIATVAFTVQNTGGRDGHEVSQVYLGFPASAGQPPRVLRGFARTLVKRGESARVSVVLRRKDVSVWDVVAQKWVLPAGEVKVDVGASSRDVRLSASFTPGG